VGEDLVEEPVQEQDVLMSEPLNLYDEETRGNYLAGSEGSDLNFDDTFGDAE